MLSVKSNPGCIFRRELCSVGIGFYPDVPTGRFSYHGDRVPVDKRFTHTLEVDVPEVREGVENVAEESERHVRHVSAPAAVLTGWTTEIASDGGLDIGLSRFGQCRAAEEGEESAPVKSETVLSRVHSTCIEKMVFNSACRVPFVMSIRV